MLASLALAACGEEAAQTAQSDAQAQDAGGAEMLASDGGPAVGTFEAIAPDGTVVIQDVRADGTLVNRFGDESAQGTWTYDPASRHFCSQLEEADAPSCYEQGMSGEDGSWTVINIEDPEDSWTIRRMAG
ncbi:hypothetical protein MACH05_17990 [Qipengyuania nanhaisediminis]